MIDRVQEIAERAASWSGQVTLPADDVRWLLEHAELARRRLERLEDVKLASRTNLDEDLVEAVAGLAAVFDEHVRVRDELGITPEADPVAAVRALVDQIVVLTEAGSVLREIAAERVRQDAKWGEQNHPDGTGWARDWRKDGSWNDLCYAGQEGGELERTARRILQGGASWAAILMEEVGEALEAGDPVALRAELVQIASVAVAWVEAIDRREGSP